MTPTSAPPAGCCGRAAPLSTTISGSIATPTADCRGCPLKPRCCPKEPARKIPRSIYEAAGDVARSLFGTEAYAQSRRDRKKVEMQFAHLKRILRLNRLLAYAVQRLGTD